MKLCDLIYLPLQQPVIEDEFIFNVCTISDIDSQHFIKLPFLSYWFIFEPKLPSPPKLAFFSFNPKFLKY